MRLDARGAVYPQNAGPYQQGKTASARQKPPPAAALSPSEQLAFRQEPYGMNKVILSLLLAVCILGMALIMLNERLGRKSNCFRPHGGSGRPYAAGQRRRSASPVGGCRPERFYRARRTSGSGPRRRTAPARTTPPRPRPSRSRSASAAQTPRPLLRPPDLSRRT